MRVPKWIEGHYQTEEEDEVEALRAERDRLRAAGVWKHVDGAPCECRECLMAERDRLREDRAAIVEALGAVTCPECEAVFMITLPALASGEEGR